MLFKRFQIHQNRLSCVNKLSRFEDNLSNITNVNVLLLFVWFHNYGELGALLQYNYIVVL